MNEESLKATSSGHSHDGVVRIPYHSPTLVCLGPIQSLVQSTNGGGSDAGIGDEAGAS